MRIDLTPAQAEVLSTLLDDCLGSLAMEISHTDNPAFRETLRRQREDLRDIRAQLDPVPVA